MVFTFLPPFPYLLDPLSTLFHELGHTVVFWAFGYPAIPSFDFLYGGGVTMALKRWPLFVFLIHLALVAVLVYLWTAKRSLFWVAALSTLIYLILAWSSAHLTLVGIAGHLATLALTGVFCFRAVRGVVGERVISEVERGLYAALGLYAYCMEWIFSWRLVASQEARQQYLSNPRGINDLRVVAKDLGLSLLTTYWLYFLVCLATPVVLFFIVRRWGPAKERAQPRQVNERRDIDSLPDVWDS